MAQNSEASAKGSQSGDINAEFADAFTIGVTSRHIEAQESLSSRDNSSIDLEKPAVEANDTSVDTSISSSTSSAIASDSKPVMSNWRTRRARRQQERRVFQQEAVDEGAWWTAAGRWHKDVTRKKNGADNLPMDIGDTGVAARRRRAQLAINERWSSIPNDPTTRPANASDARVADVLRTSITGPLSSQLRGTAGGSQSQQQQHDLPAHAQSQQAAQQQMLAERQTLQATRKELESTKLQWRTAQQRLGSTTDDLSIARQELLVAKQELSGLQQLWQASQQQVAEHANELALTRQELAAARQELGGVDQRWQATQQQLNDSASELSNARQELVATQHELAGTQQQWQASQQQLAATTDELVVTQQQLALAHQQITGMQEHWQATQQQLGGTGEELAGTRQQLVTVEHELAGTRQQWQAAQQNLNATSADLANAREEIAASKQELLGTQRQWELTRQQLNNTGDELAAARQQLLQLRHDLGETQQRWQACHQQLRSAEDQLAATRSELAVTDSTLGKGCYFLVLVQLLEKCGSLIERHTALIEKLSACIDQRTSELQSTAEQLASLRLSHRQTQDDLRELTNTGMEADSCLRGQEQLINDLHTERDKLRAELLEQKTLNAQTMQREADNRARYTDEGQHTTDAQLSGRSGHDRQSTVPDGLGTLSKAKVQSNSVARSAGTNLASEAGATAVSPDRLVPDLTELL
eukprot:SAG31_NODE_1149_length_9659_cov_4.862238_8_plen_703_part_00